MIEMKDTIEDMELELVNPEDLDESYINEVRETVKALSAVDSDIDNMYFNIGMLWENYNFIGHSTQSTIDEITETFFKKCKATSIDVENGKEDIAVIIEHLYEYLNELNDSVVILLQYQNNYGFSQEEPSHLFIETLLDIKLMTLDQNKDDSDYKIVDNSSQNFDNLLEISIQSRINNLELHIFKCVQLIKNCSLQNTTIVNDCSYIESNKHKI